MVPGLVLGFLTGQSIAHGGLEAIMVPVAMGVFAGLAVCILLLAPGITRRSGPAIAAVALVGAFLLAVVAYPGGKFLIG